jgi:hypothetical protein
MSTFAISKFCATMATAVLFVASLAPRPTHKTLNFVPIYHSPFSMDQITTLPAVTQSAICRIAS